MIDIKKVKDFLGHYDGPDMNIMEVCGSHTAAITKLGIQSLLSPHIHLISGPGCPVCVTPSAYVDKLLQLAEAGRCIVTFGDLIRVPGSASSLSIEKGKGARVEMVYSPMDIIKMAKSEPETEFIFAAVGFETTTPVYALLLEQLMTEHIKNVKLLTALKTMPPVIAYLCAHDAPVDGFLAPGHVSVVTGSDIFIPIAEKYNMPFGVAGFSGEEILTAICGIVKSKGFGRVMNFYPSVVSAKGNIKAQKIVEKYFTTVDAAWRGIGVITASGLGLREVFAAYDAGSMPLVEDKKSNQSCKCDKVLMGKISPPACPLYAKMCTPLNPQGACMVSSEGSCYAYYSSGKK